MIASLSHVFFAITSMMSYIYYRTSIVDAQSLVELLEELSHIRYKMDLNIIIPMLLFVLLTPGVLLSLPPGQSILVQSVTHSLVFGLVYYGLRMVFPQYY